MRTREIASGKSALWIPEDPRAYKGWGVGKYLVYRLCKEEGLMLKHMKLAGRRKAARQREEKLKLTAPNQA